MDVGVAYCLWPTIMLRSPFSKISKRPLSTTPEAADGVAGMTSSIRLPLFHSTVGLGAPNALQLRTIDCPTDRRVSFCGADTKLGGSAVCACNTHRHNESLYTCFCCYCFVCKYSTESTL